MNKSERRTAAATNSRETDSLETSLSAKETAVLEIFRRYLMTPGKMLCFAGSDLVTYDTALSRLLDKGLIDGEKFRGGYSLTEEGFAAMKQNS